MYISMKHGFRPIYSILLLMLVAATFIIRVMLQDGIFTHMYYLTPVEVPEKPVFNETLLQYAAVDISEPGLKKEVEELLEGNFKNRGRERSFLSSSKYNLRLWSSRGGMMKQRSPEFYRLWLTFRRHLRDWFRNRRYDSDVMSNLVDEVKVPIDELGKEKKGSKKKYKSCAVVGNSGILLNNEHGKVIDGHEAVIRLNNARIASFERNVGSKTTISFINSNILHLCARREGCFCHPYGPNVPIVMYMCQPVQFFDYLVCNSSHKAPLVLTDSRFDVLCARIVKYYSLKRFVEKIGRDVLQWASTHEGESFHYSSGMQAVLLASGICDKVSIFGFGKSQSSRHHYHTNQKAELSLHDYEAEYDFYGDLVKNPRAIPFVSDKFEFPPVVMYH